MPATEEELQKIVAITWLTLIILTVAYYTRRPLPAHEPDPPPRSKIEARVDKLESEMLELQRHVVECHTEMLRAFTTISEPDSPTTCEHAALLHRIDALDEEAKQLEASLPPS